MHEQAVENKVAIKAVHQRMDRMQVTIDGLANKADIVEIIDNDRNQTYVDAFKRGAVIIFTAGVAGATGWASKFWQ